MGWRSDPQQASHVWLSQHSQFIYSPQHQDTEWSVDDAISFVMIYLNDDIYKAAFGKKKQGKTTSVSHIGFKNEPLWHRSEWRVRCALSGISTEPEEEWSFSISYDTVLRIIPDTLWRIKESQEYSGCPTWQSCFMTLVNHTLPNAGSGVNLGLVS